MLRRGTAASGSAAGGAARGGNDGEETLAEGATTRTLGGVKPGVLAHAAHRSAPARNAASADCVIR